GGRDLLGDRRAIAGPGDHRHAAVGLRDGGMNDFLDLAEREREELAGASRREQPRHLVFAEPGDVVAIFRLVEGEVVFEAGHREGQQTRPALAGEFRRCHSGHGPAPLYVFFRFRDHTSRAKTMRTNVTVMAPPMRVAICANGMSCMRLAAVRMATSPVPPWPLWHAFT